MRLPKVTFLLLSLLSLSSIPLSNQQEAISLSEQGADWLENVQSQTLVFYDKTNKIAADIFNLGLNAYFRQGPNGGGQGNDQSFLRTNVPTFVENTNSSLEELQEPVSFLDVLRTAAEMYKELDSAKYENLQKLQTETSDIYEKIQEELKQLKSLAALEIADKTKAKAEVVEISSYENLNDFNKTMLLKLKNRLSIAVRKQSVAFNSLVVFLNSQKSRTDFDKIQGEFTSYQQENNANFNFEHVFTGNEPEEEEPKSPFSEDGGINDDNQNESVSETEVSELSVQEQEIETEEQFESLSESEGEQPSNETSVFDVDPSQFDRTPIPMTFTGIFGYRFETGGRIHFKQQIFSLFFIPHFHFFLKVLFILLVGRDRRLQQKKLDTNCVYLGDNLEANSNGNAADYDCGVQTDLEEWQIAGILDENGVAVDKMTANSLTVYNILLNSAEDQGPAKDEKSIDTESNVHRAVSDSNIRRIALAAKADKCPAQLNYYLNFTSPEATNVPCALSDTCSNLYCNMELSPSTEYDLTLSNAVSSNGQSVLFRTSKDDSDTLKLKTTDVVNSPSAIKAKNSGLSGGAIAGIIIAIAVVLVLLVVLAVCCLFKKKAPYVPAHNTSVQSIHNIGQKTY